MATFEVGQEVVILDGTSLVGRVIQVDNLELDGELMLTYLVALEGSTGRWYDATELAPAQPTPAGGGATADFDELLTQLSNSLSNHAISMLRTHFAAEHSIRTRVEAQLTADDSGYSELIDELSGKIKALERENATMIRELAMLEGERNRLRQQLAAVQAALKPFAAIYDRWTKRLLIDMYFPEWLEIHLTVQEQQGEYTRQWFETAAKALEATSE